MKPTPEQIHAALKVAEADCLDSLTDSELKAYWSYRQTPFYSGIGRAAKILADHIRAVHAECVGEIDRSNDEYECGYTAACRHYAERLIPQEGGAK